MWGVRDERFPRTVRGRKVLVLPSALLTDPQVFSWVSRGPPPKRDSGVVPVSWGSQSGC